MTEFPKDDSTATARKLRARVQRLVKRLRALNPWPPAQYSAGGFFTIPINVHGTPHDMPLGFVGSTGCTWARAGGCTMCDYGGFTGHVTDTQLIGQAKAILDQWPAETEINLSSLGSFFDDRELSHDARLGILREVAARPHIELLGIEARANNVTTRKVREAKAILGSHRCLEVGMGLESRNDFVRNVCINKGLRSDTFEKAIAVLHACDVHAVGHVLLKPPFLTEAEAIGDAVETIEYLDSLGVRRIVLMVCNVKEGTLVGELHDIGAYRPPWLWSVIKTALSVSESARRKLLIYGFDCGLPMKALGSNCPKCDGRILGLIREFCGTADPATLAPAFSQPCECLSRWREELAVTASSDLPTRVATLCKRVETTLGLGDAMRSEYP